VDYISVLYTHVHYTHVQSAESLQLADALQRQDQSPSHTHPSLATPRIITLPPPPAPAPAPPTHSAPSYLEPVAAAMASGEMFGNLARRRNCSIGEQREEGRRQEAEARTDSWPVQKNPVSGRACLARVVRRASLPPSASPTSAPSTFRASPTLAALPIIHPSDPRPLVSPARPAAYRW